MDVVVITSDEAVANELKIINELLKNGLQTLHIRKPKFSRAEFEEFIKAIPKEYHGRLVVHGNYNLAIKFKLKGVHMHRKHRSGKWKNSLKRFLLRLRNPNILISTTFHSLQSLRENNITYDYVFLSQVFHANSHYNHSDSSGINLLRNSIANSNTRVYAMGGITTSKISVIKAAGFNGVGLSKSLWTKDEVTATQFLTQFLSA